MYVRYEILNPPKMVQQVVNIPDEDLRLFLELAKKFKWKIIGKTEEQNNFVLSEEQADYLAERSNVPFNECLSKDEFFKYIDEL